MNDATKRFRCICGSRDLRFQPVAMGMRPRPIPDRPAALRPIYREDRRTLWRRGPFDLPDQLAIDAALATLQQAITTRRYGGPVVTDEQLRDALNAVRPYCYDTTIADAFTDELAQIGGTFGGHVDTVLTGSGGSLAYREHDRDGLDLNHVRQQWELPIFHTNGGEGTPTSYPPSIIPIAAVSRRVVRKLVAGQVHTGGPTPSLASARSDPAPRA